MPAKNLLFLRMNIHFTKIFLPFLLLLVIAGSAKADSKRAFKLLEKGEYGKLTELLDKSISKDSINAGAKYVYSLLYLTPKYERYNIDTAYRYILAAETDINRHEEKELQRLDKLNINDSSIQIQKSEVEIHAFRRAKSQHTIISYNYFLDHFPGALQTEQAITLRDGIAYEQAVEANTYQAFLNFLETYPEAKEISQAREHYEKLLYYTKTKNKKLATYRQFLKNYPKTPYRDDAERNIFEISCADNEINSYLKFIHDYPDSHINNRAWNFIYHKLKAEGLTLDFSKQSIDKSKADSLNLIAENDSGYLLAIYEMGKYGFINDNGTKLIDFAYTDVNENYLCGNISEDYLEVWNNTNHLLVSRLGTLIYNKSFESQKDIGCGLIQLERDGRFGVLHKSGALLTEYDYEDVKQIGNAFIAYKFKGRWGLISFTGRDILPPDHDNITAINQFIVIQNRDLFAVQNVKNLAAAANLITPELSFDFDDFESVNDSTMLLFNGDKETVIDQNLKQKIPIDNQQFFQFHDGWFVKKNGKYRLYDHELKPFSEQYFDRVESRRTRTAICLGNKWAIFDEGRLFPNTFPYDSIRFLSDRIGILTKGKKTQAMFGYDTLIDISNSVSIRLLKDQSIEVSENGRGQYLLTKTNNGSYKVYNINGKLILKGKYSSITALGKEYIRIKKSGKNGLINENGEVALKTRYKAISNYDNGYVSTFLNGKFGISNFEKNVFLSAKYTKTLKPYGSSYFIGSRNNKLAFIDFDNKDVSGFVFEKVKYWNDTSALVQSDEKWFIYGIKSKTRLYDDILEFKYLRNDENEIILLITGENGNGVLSNRFGEVIGPTFNDVINIGSKQKPVYFAEKFIREAMFYVVIYYDSKGNILRKQVFNKKEYDSIYCG